MYTKLKYKQFTHNTFLFLYSIQFFTLCTYGVLFLSVGPARFKGGERGPLGCVDLYGKIQGKKGISEHIFSKTYKEDQRINKKSAQNNYKIVHTGLWYIEIYMVCEEFQDCI